MSAERFARLAGSGYYNGLTIHRIVPNFVIQGGSPGANEYVGDGAFMRDEVGPLSHARGTLGISTRGRDTGGVGLGLAIVRQLAAAQGWRVSLQTPEDGGLAAWLGATAPAQFAVAAVAGVVATAAAHQWRIRRALPPPQAGLDVGQPVQVENWNADGTARVAYRGTQWTAELAAPDTPRARTMYIVAMRGSILVVADRRA